MEKELLRLIFNYINEHRDPDLLFASMIGKIRLANNSFFYKNTAFEQINIKQSDEGLFSAFYEERFERIFLDLNALEKIYEDILYKNSDKFLEYDLMFLRYSTFLQIILHECEHVVQHDDNYIGINEDMIVKACQTGLEAMMNEENPENFNMFLHENWLINPLERLAEINSLKITINTLSSACFMPVNLLKYYHSVYENVISNGYNYTNCPTRYFLGLINQEDIFNNLDSTLIANYPLRKRLELGLPVSKQELLSIRNH